MPVIQEIFHRLCGEWFLESLFLLGPQCQKEL